MKRNIAKLAVVLGLAGALAAPTSALAWGAQGHRTVAAIAAQLLPPAKLKAMDALMSKLKSNKNFIDSASYADEYLRNAEPQTKPWHFADLVDGGPDARHFACVAPNPKTHVMETCLFDELAANLAIIRQGKHDAAEAVALSWVIHLVGDLHQPLHMEDADVGGNFFPVTYRSSGACIGTSKAELHSVWDDCLVGEAETGLASGPHGQSVAFAAALLGPIKTYKGRPEINPSVADPWYDWGDASHALAIKVAYDHLKKHDDLKDPYILAPNNAMTTAKTQLLTAGIRLAYLLDTNFK